jgi:hypothetical protein
MYPENHSSVQCCRTAAGVSRRLRLGSGLRMHDGLQQVAQSDEGCMRLLRQQSRAPQLGALSFHVPHTTPGQ